MGTDVLILPRRYSVWLLVSCQQSLYHVYKFSEANRFDVSIAIFVLYMTSICFWSRPTYGVRRTVDTLYVKFIGLYTFYIAHDCRDENAFVRYNVCFYIAIWMYCIGCVFFEKGYKLIYTSFHILLHTLTGVGNSLISQCLKNEYENELIVPQLQKVPPGHNIGYYKKQIWIFYGAHIIYFFAHRSFFNWRSYCDHPMRTFRTQTRLILAKSTLVEYVSTNVHECVFSKRLHGQRTMS